ncbi:curli assembly protein CsgF [Devosia sp.]|uniref:curli assembly protein CsgF n=1 Tax=Devosia sp. TaxID=1871048 RepID=UPI003A8FC000
MRIFRTAVLALAIAGLAGATTASELVYKPLNPSFGGNPNMAAWLFEIASAQSLFSGTGGGGGADFGGGIGGPVIIINPNDSEVDAPGDESTDTTP